MVRRRALRRAQRGVGQQRAQRGGAQRDAVRGPVHPLQHGGHAGDDRRRRARPAEALRVARRRRGDHAVAPRVAVHVGTEVGLAPALMPPVDRLRPTRPHEDRAAVGGPPGPPLRVGGGRALRDVEVDAVGVVAVAGRLDDHRADPRVRRGDPGDEADRVEVGELRLGGQAGPLDLQQHDVPGAHHRPDRREGVDDVVALLLEVRRDQDAVQPRRDADHADRVVHPGDDAQRGVAVVAREAVAPVAVGVAQQRDAQRVEVLMGPPPRLLDVDEPHALAAAAAEPPRGDRVHAVGRGLQVALVQEERDRSPARHGRVGDHQLAVGQRDPADVAQARDRLLHAHPAVDHVDPPVAREAAQRRERAVEPGPLGLDQLLHADARDLPLGGRVPQREQELDELVQPGPAGVHEQRVVGAGRDLLVEQHDDGAAEVVPDPPLVLRGLLHPPVPPPSRSARPSERSRRASPSHQRSCRESHVQDTTRPERGFHDARRPDRRLGNRSGAT